MALEVIAQGQSSFVAPGLSADARGVACGKQLAAVLPSLEAAVSWLRAYSAESALDELLGGLSLTRARSAIGSHVLLLRVPVISVYQGDRAARIAKLVGGLCYTGTSRHFVRWRDERAPYGYDLAELQPLPEQALLGVFDIDFSETFTSAGQVPFDAILFQLALQRVRPTPVPAGAKPTDDTPRLLAVESGLLPGVMNYLWRNGVEAAVTLVEPVPAQPLGPTSDRHDGPSPYYTLTMGQLPARIETLMAQLPGMNLFRQIAANLAVAHGYEHPLNLSGCQSAFSASHFFLFWPGGRVDKLAAPLTASPLSKLIALQPPVRRAELVNATTGDAVAKSFGLQLKLVDSGSSARRVSATLIDLQAQALLKKLVFLLPPASLRRQRFAVTTAGIVLVGDEGIDLVPLGQPMYKVAPGVFVPAGKELAPRVSPDVLVQALGHEPGQLTFFATSGPFRLAEASLQPLERHALAAIEVPTTTLVVEPIPHGHAATPVTVVNDPIGRFALWRFPEPDQAPEKLLP